ncbi:class III lanthipeptide [Streptomyces inhibens]|nr:class III lanthipeptide [Streptomyces lydicus]
MTNVLALQELAEETRLEEAPSTISFIGCDT